MAALTTSTGLTRWFSVSAEVDLRQGGLVVFGWDAKLEKRSTVAILDWMAANGVMSHTGEDGSSPADRAAAAGFPYQTLGENVAAGYSSNSAGENIAAGRRFGFRSFQYRLDRHREFLDWLSRTAEGSGA